MLLPQIPPSLGIKDTEYFTNKCSCEIIIVKCSGTNSDRTNFLLFQGSNKNAKKANL